MPGHETEILSEGELRAGQQNQHGQQQEGQQDVPVPGHETELHSESELNAGHESDAQKGSGEALEKRPELGTMGSAPEQV